MKIRSRLYNDLYTHKIRVYNENARVGDFE